MSNVTGEADMGIAPHKKHTMYLLWNKFS